MAPFNAKTLMIPDIARSTVTITAAKKRAITTSVKTPDDSSHLGWI